MKPFALQPLFCFLLALGMLTPVSLSAQPQDTKRSKNKRPYQVSVVGANGQRMASGYLYQLNDESILVVEDDTKAVQDQSVTEIPVTDIKSLRFRRKGQLLRGFLIGVLGSIAASAIVQAESTNDDTAGYAIVGILAVGWIPTTLLASIKEQHTLDQLPFVYRKKKKELEKYLLPALP